MDLNHWKRRRYTPTWGDNREDPEPAVIVFLPPNIGWMARWRELAIEAPTLSDATKAKEESFLEAVQDWTRSCNEFRTGFFEAHIVAVEGLTIDDKAMPLVDALEFIAENEGLREEIFRAIIDEGSLGTAQGKDSG